MSTIKQGSWSYTLTPEDKLWAARMVEGEGPVSDSAAVLWTMTQLFSPEGQRIKYGRPDRFRSFKDLIQAYSQPINPIWRRDGSKCRPGGTAAGSDACSSSRLARRDAIARMPLSSIDPAKLAVVNRWMSGSLSNPVPGAIEFAAPSVSQSFLNRNPGWTKLGGGSNWFLQPPGGLRSAVTLGGGLLGTSLLIGAGVGLAWWLARRARRGR